MYKHYCHMVTENVNQYTHCIGGWVGPRAGLHGCGKTHPHQDSIPGVPSPQRVAILTTQSWPHAA